MKKLIAIVLLSAMLLSTLVSCGLAEPMVKGILNLSSYNEESEVQNVATGGEKASGAFRVLSFNIQQDKTNSTNRKAAILAEIDAYDPDFIGFQEDDAGWHTLLDTELAQRGYVLTNNCSTDTNFTSEWNAIYYKSGAGYTLVETGYHWLSDDGSKKIAMTLDDIPADMKTALETYCFTDEAMTTTLKVDSLTSLTGTKVYYTSDAAGTEVEKTGYLVGPARNMTYALMQDASGNQFLYVNTHVQHRSTNGYNAPIWGIREIERLKQWNYLIDFIETKYPGVPVVLTGDMNEHPGKNSYNAYTEIFDDASVLAKVYRGTDGTWNSFYSSSGIGEIVSATDTLTHKIGYSTSTLDYCLVTPGAFTVEQFQIGDGVYDAGTGYVATSDHKAVVVDLKLGADETPIVLQKPGSERSPISYYSGTPDTSWYTGEAGATYVLTTADQLMGFMNLRATAANQFDGMTVKLGANMVINKLKDGVTEATSLDDFETRYTWKTLNSSYYFEGVFDGQGHYISGVYFVSGNSGAKGLLGGIGDATIKNFALVNTFMLTSDATNEVKNRMGSIAARVNTSGTATFYNIESSAVITPPTENGPAFDKLGGIVGLVQGNSTVVMDYCTFSGSLEADGERVGGLIGSIESANAKVTISRCKNTGTIVAGDMTGGMVGYVNAAAFTLSSSANLGKIDALRCSGGLIGTAHGCEEFFVSNCVVNAEMDFSRIAEGGTSSSPVYVPAGAQVGGLIGRTFNVYGHVTKCLTAGSMKGAKYMDTDLLSSAEHHAEGGILGFASQYPDHTTVMTLGENESTAVTQLHFNSMLTSLDITDVENYYGGTRDFSIASADGLNRLSWSVMAHDSDKKNASGMQVFGFNLISGERVNKATEPNGQGAGDQKVYTTLFYKTWEGQTYKNALHNRWSFSEEIAYPVPNEVVKELLKETKYVDESGAGYRETTSFRTELNASADATTGTDISWFTGDKTEYTLTTAAQLRGFFKLRATKDSNGAYPNTFEGVTIKLGLDMNVNGEVEVIPSASIFLGTFDGQGYVISGMKLVSNGSATRGFFGPAAGNAAVKNVSIINSSVTVNSVGLDSEGTLTGAKATTGAIFTRIDQDANGNATDADVLIENVYSDVDITFRSATITYTATADDATKHEVTAVETYASKGVGGFVGYVKYGKLTVKNCVNAGDISANANEVGGFVGQIWQSAAVVLENCQHTGRMIPLNTIVVGGSNGTYGADYTLSEITYLVTEWDVSNDIYSWGGFVGSLSNTATLSMTNCTNYASILNIKNRAAGFVGYVSSSSTGITLNATNCVNYGAVMTRNGRVGALLGEYNGKAGSTINGNKLINKAAMTSNGENVAGMIGYVNGLSGKIHLANAVNDGDVTGAENYVGGIIGFLGGTSSAVSTTEVSLTACVNNGNLSGKNYVGGIMGRGIYLSTQTIDLTNCVNTGDIFIAARGAGGMIGEFHGNGTSLKLSGCSNSGSMDFDHSTSSNGLFMGGMLGYVYGSDSGITLASVEIDNCKNTGDITGNRCSGGLVGFIQRCVKVGIYNSEVDADLEFIIDSSNNYNAGGLIARFDLSAGNDAFLYNNTVKGSMQVRDIDSNKITVYSAGLIGYVNSGDVIAKACTVDMKFSMVGPYVTSADKLCVFLGGKASSNVTFTAKSEMKYVLHGEAGDNGINTLGTGVTATAGTATSPDNIQQIGAQYRKNANGTYDIRYVFGVVSLADTVEAIGFNVKVMTAEGGTWSTKEVTVYCPNIYKSINGGGEIYSAVDLGMSYLFTLTIAGLPADRVNIEDGRIYVKNSMLTLTPFTATSETSSTKADAIYVGKSNLVTYNDFSFSTTLPDGFSGDGIIPAYAYPTKGADVVVNDGCVQINGYSDTNQQFMLKHTCANTAASHTCSPLCANGTMALLSGTNARYHYYIAQNEYKTEFGTALERYAAYHTWTFEVDADGVYDFCFQLRVKDNVTRYALIQIDDQDYDEQTTLVYHMNDYTNIISSKTSSDATYQDTYITGFSAELTAGTHTITIRMPYNATSYSMHFRNIYVKAAN